MDKEDYTPYIFTKDQIEEELLFIPEGGMPDMAHARPLSKR
jgi:Translation elongation factor P (EF-P)/translation initiation factor 5A (eIF-5A)